MCVCVCVLSALMRVGHYLALSLCVSIVGQNNGRLVLAASPADTRFSGQSGRPQLTQTGRLWPSSASKKLSQSRLATSRRAAGRPIVGPAPNGSHEIESHTHTSLPAQPLLSPKAGRWEGQSIGGQIWLLSRLFRPHRSTPAHSAGPSFRPELAPPNRRHLIGLCRRLS